MRTSDTAVDTVLRKVTLIIVVAFAKIGRVEMLETKNRPKEP